MDKVQLAAQSHTHIQLVNSFAWHPVLPDGCNLHIDSKYLSTNEDNHAAAKQAQTATGFCQPQWQNKKKLRLKIT